MYNPISINEIQQIKFPETEYYKEETQKTQIVLHHTVSGNNIDGDISTWLQPGKVGTHFIVDRQGKCYQLFSSKYWINHLGIKTDVFKKYGFKDFATRNTLLNKASIGIELDNWGYLKYKDNKYYNAYEKESICEVVKYDNPFKQYNYYEKYTDIQLDKTMQLIKLLSQTWNIPLNYNSDMWEVSKNALGGQPGIWTHVSYRSDKSDCHPQLELINRLKSL